MAATAGVLVKFEPEALAAIDRVRGAVPRTVWIKGLCADAVAAAAARQVDPAKLGRAQEVSQQVVGEMELSPRARWLQTLGPGR